MSDDDDFSGRYDQVPVTTRVADWADEELPATAVGAGLGLFIAGLTNYVMDSRAPWIVAAGTSALLGAGLGALVYWCERDDWPGKRAAFGEALKKAAYMAAGSGAATALLAHYLST